MKTTACLLFFVVMALTRSCPAANVVGFKISFNDAFVAVRGTVPANSAIDGIRFYSNDATRFPEVVLYSDSGERGLPRLASSLRVVSDVDAHEGYVTVEFEPYHTTTNEIVWALVRFPRDRPITAKGHGGGAGIGWTDQERLFQQESFYCVDGQVAVFAKPLDISLVTREIVSKSGTGVAPGTHRDWAHKPESVDATTRQRLAEQPDPLVYINRIVNRAGGSTEIQFHVGASTRIEANVYDVVGRRQRSLVRRVLPAGDHRLLWDGRSDHGTQVATGIYIVALSTPDITVRRKVLVLR